MGQTLQLSSFLPTTPHGRPVTSFGICHMHITQHNTISISFHLYFLYFAFCACAITSSSPPLHAALRPKLTITTSGHTRWTCIIWGYACRAGRSAIPTFKDRIMPPLRISSAKSPRRVNPTPPYLPLPLPTAPLEQEQEAEWEREREVYWEGGSSVRRPLCHSMIAHMLEEPLNHPHRLMAHLHLLLDIPTPFPSILLSMAR
jgi:hypothetical protein